MKGTIYLPEKRPFGWWVTPLLGLGNFLPWLTPPDEIYVVNLYALFQNESGRRSPNVGNVSPHVPPPPQRIYCWNLQATLFANLTSHFNSNPSKRDTTWIILYRVTQDTMLLGYKDAIGYNRAKEKGAGSFFIDLSLFKEKSDRAKNHNRQSMSHPHWSACYYCHPSSNAKLEIIAVQT